LHSHAQHATVATVNLHPMRSDFSALPPLPLLDLLPPVYDAIHEQVAGKVRESRRALIVTAFLEHIHHLVQGTLRERTVGVENEISGSTPPQHSLAEAPLITIDTFDRFSTQLITRADAVDRVAAVVENDALADIAVALIEIRADLLLARSQICLAGIGDVLARHDEINDAQAYAQWVAKRSNDLAERVCLGRGEWRRRFQRVGDELRLSILGRPPCGYRIHVPRDSPEADDKFQPVPIDEYQGSGIPR
jgi:hypothetical protein